MRKLKGNKMENEINDMFDFVKDSMLDAQFDSMVKDFTVGEFIVSIRIRKDKKHKKKTNVEKVDI
jgi:hypothetical protein